MFCNAALEVISWRATKSGLMVRSTWITLLTLDAVLSKFRMFHVATVKTFGSGSESTGSDLIATSRVALEASGLAVAVIPSNWIARKENAMADRRFSRIDWTSGGGKKRMRLDVVTDLEERKHEVERIGKVRKTEEYAASRPPGS